MDSNIGIIATGYYLPQYIRTNEELSQMVNTTDEWIYSKVGIKERRIASAEETTSDLAMNAGLDALKNANLNPSEIDLIVLATSTPDMIQPSTGAIVQGKLGAYNAVAFDVSAVCAGFNYALSVGYSMMVANPSYKNVLIIASETYSRIIDWQDRTTCVYFGDGAGAAILSHTKEQGIVAFELYNDGTGADVIRFQGGGAKFPASEKTLKQNLHRFEMDGKKVWNFATTICPIVIKKMLSGLNKQTDEIDWIITHQANINIIKNILNDLEIPFSKTYTNLEKYGNTSGASVIIALAEANKKGLLKKGDEIILAAFGGGLSCASVYLKWIGD